MQLEILDPSTATHKDSTACTCAMKHLILSMCCLYKDEERPHQSLNLIRDLSMPLNRRRYPKQQCKAMSRQRLNIEGLRLLEDQELNISCGWTCTAVRTPHDAGDTQLFPITIP